MKILEIKDCPKSSWFQSKQVLYENDEGVELQWDYIERIASKVSVIVVPRFKESGDFLLVRQYRVIFDKYIIGFPAGIIDGNETVEAGALRELQEETGYSGRIKEVSPPLTTNSALIREAARCILVELDDNAIPRRQRLEASEKIEVFRVKESDLSSFLENATARGDLISAGPWFVHMTAERLKG
ncbi:MAG: NUDIX hydrolase [Deltaproteobacteria bacterium]|nr:NUDIX hydrolase [Deltaproteobacteria bacterium]